MGVGVRAGVGLGLWLETGLGLGPGLVAGGGFAEWMAGGLGGGLDAGVAAVMLVEYVGVETGVATRCWEVGEGRGPEGAGLTVWGAECCRGTWEWLVVLPESSWERKDDWQKPEGW